MKAKNICDINKIHTKKIQKALQNLPSETEINEMSVLFSTLSDQTRLKILYALLSQQLCGCDLAKITLVSKSAVSHQMRILKMTKLVKAKRVGKQVFYSIADEHVKQILLMALSHVREEEK
ncbi:ArsR/SmtB family transcription factor [Pseudothermotoga thermarum]|uniref:Regulatory protein ArsR n=1 Tax=Pseudothermotoga thermarum DSM 5069 TaxID=688269 RepID=F7YYQ7_9THEM|nr:metalloregulator ArsR/SmtB family transcription factor [Pseudothermotoga thermarum]AEH51092.1 regulatory protein ArsR [Pseudothermotoga thermarum DSM 5069]